MLPVPKHWTIEDYATFPDDGNRYEIIDGALFVTPSPTWSHASVLEEFRSRLGAYVKAHRIGRIFASPADIVLGEDTVVQPDLFVLPLGLGIREWSEVHGRLLLAVEVVSPSTARRDHTMKRDRYLRAGIPQYWIVDVRRRLVERWRPGDADPEVIDGTLRWMPAADQPALEIDLPALFAEAVAD